MLNDIFDMSFISFYLIVKEDYIIMLLVISYFVTFAYHIFGFKVMQNKFYSVLTMLFVLFILITIKDFYSFNKEYSSFIGNNEIEELIIIKNSKKILQKDKTYINLKIKEITEDYKITYFEFLKIKLLYNQALKNFDSFKKEEKEIAKITSLNT